MPPRRTLSSRPQSVQGVNCHKAPSAVDGTATQVAFSARDVMPGVHNSHSRTESSIQESRRLLQCAMLEQGIPGGVGQCLSMAASSGVRDSATLTWRITCPAPQRV